MRAGTQFPVTRNSQITESLSQEPSWTYIQLFYGKYIRHSSFYSFLTVFWILSGRIRRKFGPLVLFNKDGKLQLKKIDEWMKTWWINIFTFFEMLARIFVFLFSNNRSISIYCLGIYKINGLILFWQALQIRRRKRRRYSEQRDKVKITDQSEALFKQKRWFKTKTNDHIASMLETGLFKVVFLKSGILFKKKPKSLFLKSGIL